MVNQRPRLTMSSATFEAMVGFTEAKMGSGSNVKCIALLGGNALRMVCIKMPDADLHQPMDCATVGVNPDVHQD